MEQRQALRRIAVLPGASRVVHLNLSNCLLVEFLLMKYGSSPRMYCLERY